MRDTIWKSMPWQAILIAVLLALVIGCPLACSTGDPEAQLRQAIFENCRFDVDQFILERIRQNRIVMLSDFEHGNELPRQSIIRFLNYSLDQIETADTSLVPITSKLFLVLEANPGWMEGIRNYIASGEIRDLTGKQGIPCAVTSDIFTIEDLEFYQDLGAFQTRVQQHNGGKAAPALTKYVSTNNPRGGQVEFSIVGIEEDIDLDNWSIAKRDSFFIWQRDEHSSQRAIDLLEQNPDFHALVFYGSAHLAKDVVHKNTYESSSHPGVKGDGYFLAHYLLEHFRDKGGVYTITRGWIQQLNPHCYYAPNRTYAIDNACARNIATDEIPGQQLAVLSDGMIVYFEPRNKPTPVVSIWSENLVAAAILTLDLTTNMENEFMRDIHLSMLRYLETFSGVVLPPELKGDHDSATVARRIQVYREWHAAAKTDVVADLDTCGPALRNLARLSALEHPMQKQCIGCIGTAMGSYFPTEDNKRTASELAPIYSRYFEANKQAIATESLIHLLWVGTEKEKSHAVERLQERTGQNLTTAKEWTVWWRANRIKDVDPEI